MSALPTGPMANVPLRAPTVPLEGIGASKTANGANAAPDGILGAIVPLAEADGALVAPAIPRARDFGAMLRFYRLRAGLSQNRLAQCAGINASYINRLESGERETPTREVVMALGRPLDLLPAELDALMASGGHLPPGQQKLGPGDSTLAAVVRTLTDDRLSPECRADLRAVIETICIRWSGRTPTRSDLKGGR